MHEALRSEPPFRLPVAQEKRCLPEALCTEHAAAHRVILAVPCVHAVHCTAGSEGETDRRLHVFMLTMWQWCRTNTLQSGHCSGPVESAFSDHHAGRRTRTVGDWVVDQRGVGFGDCRRRGSVLQHEGLFHRETDPVGRRDAPRPPPVVLEHSLRPEPP